MVLQLKDDEVVFTLTATQEAARDYSTGQINRTEYFRRIANTTKNSGM